MFAAIGLYNADIVMPPQQRVEPQIVEFDPGRVLCDGEDVAPTVTMRPLPTGTFRDPQVGTTPASWTIAFRIDADGRPMSIGQPSVANIGGYVSTEDLSPALAAWRFKPGVAHSGCSVAFTARIAPVSQAPADMLYRFLALPRIGSIAWAEARQRIAADNPGCFTPHYPKPVLQGFPDFDAITEPAGGMSYTMTGFDVDRSGKPTHVRTIGSDGNAALDQRATAAIARSRFGADARTGCNYPFYRRQNAPMLAPPAPERDIFVGAAATCDNAVAFVRKPVMTFPEPYRRRAIEGWAVVRYDVAPWGATGNIQVLASEPAAAFGDAARQIIGAATRPASPNGSSGCVDRIIFKLPSDGEKANTTDVLTEQ